jgi:murein peptide amidase A
VLHLVVAAALALGGHPAAAKPFSAHGISGTLPPGWRVVHRRFTPCIDPQEVLAVSSFAVPKRARMDPRGAFLLLEERRGSTDGLPPRPARFSLAGRPEALSCCEPFAGAPGWSVDFQAAGRGFYGYAYVGTKADTRRRAELLDVLDGLRFADHRPRDSRSLGLPWAGRLVGGVRLAAAGRHFFTWDPVLRRKPDRSWRRYGNARVVRIVRRIVAAYAAAHPRAARVGIGDLSRPHGGDFGARFGGLGHVSHQNGLDVDVYYPRRDGREEAPTRPAQIDHALAQDLVDRFVRAGAGRIFVGPSTGLTGPRGIVEVLAHHDNHLHARFAVPSVRRTVFLGRSVRGFPISALERGDPGSSRKVLVVGCIHGTECAGIAVVRLLAQARVRGDVDLWLVPNLNPDGFAAGTRQNAHGVDLNRNFPAMWTRIGRPGSLQWSGPRPLSEPESRIARRLILRLRPALSLWFHQPQAVVRAWGPSIPAARRYARLAGVPFRALAWPNGTVSNWQNHLDPHAASFVVELPGGPLTPTAAKPYADALLRLAQ